VLAKFSAFLKALFIFVIAFIISAFRQNFFVSVLLCWVWIAPWFEVDHADILIIAALLTIGAFYEKVSEGIREVRKLRSALGVAAPVTNNYFQVQMPELAPRAGSEVPPRNSTPRASKEQNHGCF